jgi:hypothetical protein
LHFSLSFEGVKGDPTVVTVKRMVTLFDGPTAMSERQRAFLHKVIEIFSQGSTVKII